MTVFLSGFAPSREHNTLSHWERAGVRVRSMEGRIAENVAKLLEAE